LQVVVPPLSASSSGVNLGGTVLTAPVARPVFLRDAKECSDLRDY
jgi:hypothetical protein